MRAILVGVIVVGVAMAGPAFGGGIVDDTPSPARAVSAQPEAARPVHAAAPGPHAAPPFRHIVVEEYHNAGAEFGMGLGSAILSLVYTPVRMTIGLLGAGLGGAAGWATGGDMRTARSIWRPLTEGDYYIRPDHFDGAERYEFSNTRPVVRERYTVRGLVTDSHVHDAVVAPAAVEETVEYDDAEDDVEVELELEGVES
jgi:hypothetical protein